MLKLFKRLSDLERRVTALENQPKFIPEPVKEDLAKRLSEETERLYSEGISNILGYDYTKKREEK